MRRYFVITCAMLFCAPFLFAQQDGHVQTDTMRIRTYTRVVYLDSLTGGTFHSLGFHIGVSNDPCEDGPPAIYGFGYGMNFSLWSDRRFFGHLGVSVGSHMLAEAAVGYHKLTGMQFSLGFTMIQASKCVFSHNGSWTSADNNEFSPALLISAGTAGSGLHLEIDIYFYLRSLEYRNDLYYPTRIESMKPVVTSLRIGYAW